MLGIGALAVGAKKAFDFIGDSVMSAAQTERYEAVLQTMLGSKTAALERMNEYKDIARITPFDLNDVVEAGNKLQAIGRYSRDNLVMMGDLAAASGKPMEQALSAYSKLVSGQKGMAVDMFRDLLITTEDWTEATGKGVSNSGALLASTEEMAKALPKIMKSKGYFGMMANMSETTEGKIANLGDSFFQLKVAVGERFKPAYDKFLSTASGVIDKLTEWIEIPIEQKIAKEKMELNTLVESLIENNDKQDIRKSLIEEIQRKYPDFIKNIDLEKSTTEDLRKELEKVNGEYDKKILKAGYERKLQKLISENEDDVETYNKYQQSILATKQRSNLQQELAALLKDGSYASGRVGITKDGQIYYVSQFTSTGGNSGAVYSSGKSYYDSSKLSNEDYKHAELLINQIIALGEFIMFVDEKDLKNAYDEVKKGKDKIAALMSLYAEPEPYGPPLPPDWNVPKNQNGNGSTNTGNLENSAEAITGGGKGVKNFYINIENLLRENTNIFQSSSDDPASAGDFMERMKYTLEDVVNDVNSSGG
jgi:predicted heme/steroid binding protein